MKGENIMGNELLCAPLGTLGDGLTKLEEMRKANPNIRRTSKEEGGIFYARYIDQNHKKLGYYISCGPYYQIGKKTCFVSPDHAYKTTASKDEIVYCQETTFEGRVIENQNGKYVIRESLADKNEDLVYSLKNNEISPETEKYRVK